MSVPRSRREEKNYARYRKAESPDYCVFCAVGPGEEQFVQETASFKVLANLFPYSVWDGQKVVSHLMVSPKSHSDNLADLTDEQKIEYVNILQAYEAAGYSVYARAPKSPIKSIEHQHTHLIQAEGGPKRFIMLLRRPYIRIVR